MLSLSCIVRRSCARLYSDFCRRWFAVMNANFLTDSFLYNRLDTKIRVYGFVSDPFVVAKISDCHGFGLEWLFFRLVSNVHQLPAISARIRAVIIKSFECIKSVHESWAVLKSLPLMIHFLGLDAVVACLNLDWRDCGTGNFAHVACSVLNGPFLSICTVCLSFSCDSWCLCGLSVWFICHSFAEYSFVCKPMALGNVTFWKTSKRDKSRLYTFWKFQIQLLVL